LPEIYYAKAAATLDPVARIDRAEQSCTRPAQKSPTAETAPITASRPTPCKMPPFESFRDADSYYSTLAQ